jgi:zinc transporter ZupT
MLLAASIAALIIGPVLFQITKADSRTLGFLEGFTFITIAGLLCFSILPQAIGVGGVVAWMFAVLGLLFPIGLERLFHHLARQVHLVILLVGVTGLAVHAVIDGVALAVGGLDVPHDAELWWHLGHREGGDNLAFAVVLHRFPLGLAVWYLLAPTLGMVSAIVVLGVLTAGTLIGFALGPELMSATQLHIIIYEPGHHKHAVSDRSQNLKKWPDRIGLVCGLVMLYVYL